MLHSLPALAGLVVSQAAASGDPGSLLIGVAAIIAAVVPLAIALLARRRRNGDDTPDEAEQDSIYDDARRRIDLLVDTVRDLEEQLRDCRKERQRLTRELNECVARERLTDMEIGDLERRLADARASLHQALTDLTEAREHLRTARADLADRPDS